MASRKPSWKDAVREQRERLEQQNKTPQAVEAVVEDAPLRPGICHQCRESAFRLFYDKGVLSRECRTCGDTIRNL